MRDKSSIKEIVEIFCSDTMPLIRENSEVPRFNIVFDEDAFALFENVKNSQVESVITDEDIALLRENNHISLEYPTIIVKDFNLFFEYLKEISEETYKLFAENNNTFYLPSMIQLVLNYIWLRMGPTDFDNVEAFLKRQLEFVKSRSIDYYKNDIVAYYQGYPVKAEMVINDTWYESTRHMSFTIMDGEKVHTLPMIHYDILEEDGKKVCYIYAIQNPDHRQVNPKINRLLYKLNKGVLGSESDEYIEYKKKNSSYYPENISDTSPSAVLSLLTFFNILENNDINNVKVPLLQVMNYDYHQLLSKKVKEEFDDTWNEEKKRLSPNEYEDSKKWYDHVVDKQDFISKTKTENLVRTVRRCLFHKPEMSLRTIPFEESDYLDIVLNKEKIKKKSL